MAKEVEQALAEIKGELNDKSFNASNYLASIGTEEVVSTLVELLTNDNPETRLIAARTLGISKNNDAALPHILEALKQRENVTILGDLLMALEGFDISESYVELFKHYLFGSFKVSRTAADLLDHKEFNITARVIKKAQKHWAHYENNVKHDEAFELQKIEVEERMNDLKSFIETEKD
ncbi:MAG: hypothetical protein ACJAXX_002921 [Roseivirga sp.]|jgi:hypothetical protein